MCSDSKKKLGSICVWYWNKIETQLFIFSSQEVLELCQIWPIRLALGTLFYQEKMKVKFQPFLTKGSGFIH